MATLDDIFAQALRLHQTGNLPQAEQYYHYILQAAPNHSDSHHLLGVIDYQRGDFNSALARIRNALALNPWIADYYTNLGSVYQELGQIAEAVDCFRMALQLNPQLAEAYCNLGNALQRDNGYDEAIRCYEEALRLKPDCAEAHYNFGVVRGKQGHVEGAIAHYQRALACKSDYVEAHNNLGNAMSQQGKSAEAEAHYREALNLNPQYAEAHSNLGTVLADRADLEDAQAHYERALQLKPSYAQAHWNRSLLWLLSGDFERGWAAYEWRWTQPNFARRSFPQPRWDGSPFDGKTILLYAEQGLGDAVQFVRYAALVKERGGRVVVECHSALVPLLGAAQGIDVVLPFNEPLPEFDMHAPLLSLPGIFHTALDTIPAKVPYLHVNEALMTTWRDKLLANELDNNRGATARRTPDARRFMVGIAWQGNPALRGDRARSIPLTQFGGLASVAGIELFSLQVGHGTDQLADLKPGTANYFPLIDLGKQFNPDSLVDAAAVLKNLDLVITVDTAVAHLAGAMAVPVWVALPVVPDWRWLLHRDDSPWYPTMRLFRQTQAAHWEDVFERIAGALTGLVS